MEPLLIISADNHAGGRIEDYAQFIEARYRDDLQALQKEQDDFQRVLGRFSQFSDDDLAIMDEREAIRSGGRFGAWDVARRIKEMDDEGVVAEVVHAGHQEAVMPFFSQLNRRYSADLRWAGVKAYHRWFASCAAQGDGRLVGVGDPGPCLDLQETVRELHWLADNHFVSVSVPGVIAAEPLPPLYDLYYDPFWQTCADRGLVLSVHAGWGAPQGIFFEYADHLDASSGGEADLMEFQKQFRDSEESPFALTIEPRRVLWQLILGGVFDRHPTLKLAFTEIRADWVPATLQYLDEKFAREKVSTKLKPSEYFAKHCYVTPSSPRANELAMLDAIGSDRFLFGVDYPHPESTWPNTHDWIHSALDGLSEENIRKVLGFNAIECYGLDRPKMTQLAARIGPSFGSIFSDSRVDPRRLDHFNMRAGFQAPAEEVDRALLDVTVNKDLEKVGELLKA